MLRQPPMRRRGEGSKVPMGTRHRTKPTKPQCAAQPAILNPSAPPMPTWQRQRVRHLTWAMRQIERRISKGDTLAEAAKDVSLELKSRCPNARNLRIPTKSATLIRKLYHFRTGGAELLRQRYGDPLPAVPDAMAIEFLNWVTGRHADQLAPLWSEFKARGSRRGNRADLPGPRRVLRWFDAFRQRLASLDANGGTAE